MPSMPRTGEGSDAISRQGRRVAIKAATWTDDLSAPAMLRPRSFLIIGHLDQLRGPGGGHHRDHVRSFELYRRQMHEPEIVTFDELLARAEWHVTTASDEIGQVDTTP
jgi:hypothetical protein